LVWFSLLVLILICLPDAHATVNELYKPVEAHSQFTSMGYLLRVFGTMAGLLLVFYGVAKWLIPRWMQLQGISTPRNPTLNVPLLKPKVLFKTTLAPGRDLHVVEVQNKILVVGSTAHQISVLTELETETPKPEKSEGPSESIYQKYLQ